MGHRGDARPRSTRVPGPASASASATTSSSASTPPTGASRWTGGRACSTSTRIALARDAAAAGAAGDHLHRHRARRHADRPQPLEHRRGGPGRRHPRVRLRRGRLARRHPPARHRGRPGRASSWGARSTAARWICAAAVARGAVDAMLCKRLIPCLDVKDGRVVKGVRFVELRDAGDPVEPRRWPTTRRAPTSWSSSTSPPRTRGAPPCSTWCAAPPRASTCRSRWAAASARSRTCGRCCAPAPTRCRSTPPRSSGPP